MSNESTSRTGVGRSDRFRHEALVYGTDQEFLDIVVPFLQDGVRAAEPTLVAVNTDLATQVADALPDPGRVSFLHGEQYRSPLGALRDNYAVFAHHTAAGAARIRMVGEVPHPGTGGTWDGWARYEAAINHFYAAFPLWAICPYDVRTAPDQVLTDVLRAHPDISTTHARRQPNPRYQEPARFLTELAAAEVDPLRHSTPAVELVGPTPRQARQAVAAQLHTSNLTIEQTQNLIFAVSEAVLNATIHGDPPVRLRAWTAPDRVLVTVHDHGPGPADPFSGLLPDPPGTSGRLGLWLAHQLCDRVTLIADPDGFTVHLVAGAPHPATPP